MGKVGRYFCVAVPFILTILSIIFLLVAALSGVTNKDLFMFEIDLSELSISTDSIQSLINSRALNGRDILDDIGGAAGDILGDDQGGDSGSSITPSDLGLDDVYKVSVWGYCKQKSGDDDAECTKPKMNWANEALDTSFIEDISEALGSDFEIPEEIKSALNTFKTVSRWTQIVFIIALAALGAQIIVGTFSACTRIASCICFLIAGLSTVATIAAAGLSTATAAVIVGALEGSSEMYGAKGEMNTGFLALVWIAVAFAIGAACFWLITICCCSPDRSSRRERRNAKHADNEKGFAATSYEPLQDPNDPYHHGTNNSYNNYSSQASNNAPSFYEQPYHSQYPSHGRSDMAYEPYSHRA
jgi:hypothetical protein